MTQPRQLVYSALICPDGTVLESKYGHDFVAHTQADGRFYMLDGGLEYQRYSSDEYGKIVSIYADDHFELVRTHWSWGRNQNKEGKTLPKTQWIRLCDMDYDHLEHLLVYPRAHEWCKELFRKEIQYRDAIQSVT